MTHNEIHPTAIIAPGASLGTGNVIGPYVVIGASVALGDNNWVGAGATLGAPPEVRGAELERTGARPTTETGLLVLGDRNVIREQVTIGRGWASSTWVGSDCYIMAGSYIAHDCAIGSHATLSSGVRLAGHVRIGPYANLGMGVVVHQRVHVGPAAMVGMSAVVTRELLPFSKSYGSPARMRGHNTYLLEKFHVEPAAAEALARALKLGEENAEAEALAPELWPHVVTWHSAP